MALFPSKLKARLVARDEATRAAEGGTLGRVLENAGWLIAGKGVGAWLSLIYIGIATRTLGPTNFGQFVLIVGAAQAAAVFVTFQTWQVIVRYGVAHLQAGRRDALDRLISFAITLDMAGAIVGCVLVSIGVPLLGPHMGWSPALQLHALLFCFAMLLTFRSAAVGILRLHDRYALSAAADSMTPIVRLIGALAVLAAGPSITGFLIAWVIAELMAAATHWIFVRRTLGPGRITPFRRGLLAVPRENAGLWHFVAITNAGSTLGAMGKQFAVILVGIMAGAAAAGSYRLAHQLGQALAKVADLLSRAMFSELARAHVSDNRDQLGKLFRRASLMALFGGIAIITILLLFGRPMLGLVAGKEYLSAYPLLLLLGAAAALDVAGVSYEPALMTTGRAGLAFKLRVTATLFLLAGLLVLLPMWGAIGAGLAMLAASALGFTLFSIAAWRVVHPRA